MGFRNPYRIQVDSNDVAYITDYSPDSNIPENFRGPAGTGRVEIVRKPSNYGWPLCYAPEPAVLPLELQHLDARWTRRRPSTSATTRRAARRTCSRWVVNGGPTVEPGLEYAPPIVQPDIWYSYRDNTAAARCWARRAWRTTTAPGGTCPRLFPELFTGGVAPHGAAKYEFNPANPNKKKFPPYYDNSMFLGEFGQDTLREVRLDATQQGVQDQPAAQLRRGAGQPAPQPFECDNPNDMQFGADGAFYLLTYGDGFFAANADAGMYKWEYVKGQRAPSAVLDTDRTDGPAPLTVQFTSTGTTDADPGDALTYAWDFTNDGTDDSTDAEPYAHLHDQGRLHGEADREGLQRPARTSSPRSSRSATRRHDHDRGPDRRRLLRVGPDGSRTGSRSPTPRTAPVDCSKREGHVRARPRPARPRARTSARLHRLARDAGRGRVARRLHRRRHQRRPTPTRAAPAPRRR